MTTWTVYKHIGADDRLLYVGCTGNLAQRTATHRYRAAWWSQVVKVEPVAEFAVRADALGYELALIIELSPEHNILYKPRPVSPEIEARFAPFADKARAWRRQDLLSRAIPREVSA